MNRARAAVCSAAVPLLVAGVLTAAGPASAASAGVASTLATAGTTTTGTASSASWAARLGHPVVSLAALPATAPRAVTPTSVPRLAPDLYDAAGVSGAARSAIQPTTGGTVEVTVTGSSSAAAARALGADIVATYRSAATVTIAASELVGLSRASGVTRVSAVHRAYAQGVTGQQVVGTDAQAWIKAGVTGVGVKIGIVDVGFGGLTAQIKAGNLPSNTVFSGKYCADTRTDSNASTEQHGTAVAEVIHQVAPSAKLYLYCVDDNVGFAAAEQKIEQDGVHLVNSSLGFSADGRGDGTGVSTAAFVSTGVTVARARQAGILWFESAGNSAQDHWSGSLSDQDSSGAVRLFDSSPTPNVDLVALLPDSAGLVSLDWDQWPRGTDPVSLQVAEYSSSSLSAASLVSVQVATTDDSGQGLPVRNVDIVNSSAVVHYYVIRVFWNRAAAAAPTSAVHYDLSYLGDVSPSLLADPGLFGLHPVYGDAARAAAGSILEPASSPDVIAVGAKFWNGGLESFSSRGPTIDGRVKPDLLAPDGVSSPVYGSNGGSATESGGFFGTSASAPAAAAAAALYKSAHASTTSEQVRTAILASVYPAVSPPTSAAGHGSVRLGAPDAGSLYQALTPTRILDTRGGLGVGRGRLGAGRTVPVAMPAAVPTDATAVVAQITAAQPAGATSLTAYPAQRTGTVSLNVPASRSATATVTVGLVGHRFILRDNGAATHVIVDIVGYFAPTGSGFAAVTPTRILDTRGSLGQHHGKVRANETVTLHPSAARVPLTATAVVLDVTSPDQNGTGWLTAYGRTFRATTALSYSGGPVSSTVVVGASSGVVHLRNLGHSADLIVDVVGYFGPSASGHYHPLTTPTRFVDTRSGLGTAKSAFTSGRPRSVTDIASAGAPHSATAGWVAVSTLGRGTGVLYAYSGGRKPLAPVEQIGKGRSATTSAVLSQPLSGLTVVTGGASSDVLMDLYGYFTG